MGIKRVGKRSGWKHKYSKIDEIIYNKFLTGSKKKYKESYWMTSSEEANKKYSDAFDVPLKQMYVTGQPKDDSFINNKNNDLIEKIRKENPNCKIVAYLPTHRNFGEDRSIDMVNPELLKMVDNKLSENNIIMIFKPHFHEFKNYKCHDSIYKNIILATDLKKYSDVYEFLPSCDALITDYSGIMLGYLTSGKPIIYFPYDLDKYKENDTGLYYDYEEISAGPVCFNWEDVIMALSNLDYISKTYEHKYKIIRDRFSAYNDGKNCERVYKQVLEIIRED